MSIHFITGLRRWVLSWHTRFAARSSQVSIGLFAVSGQYLALIECFLIGTHLVYTDMLETGLDILIDLLFMLLYIIPANDRLSYVLLSNVLSSLLAGLSMGESGRKSERS